MRATMVRGNTRGAGAPLGACLALIVLAAGCALGPRTVIRDRFDYSAAVADSWKSQMLLNLVRIRYGDTGVFLDVGQIVAGYSLESVASAGVVWNIFGVTIPHPNVPNNIVTGGIAGRFTDRPTITYTPLMGERFARSMMSPIPPAAVLSLLQAGYPVDLVLRLMVSVVNGIANRYGGDARARPADPEFYPLLERMRRVQLSGGIGMRVHRINNEESVLMTFRGKLDPGIEEEIRAIRHALGLDPEAREFRIVYGSVSSSEREVAILTRSALEVLVDLSSFITVPEVHVTERRVAPTAEPEAGPAGPLRPLIQVASGTEPPADAFVAVPYRGHWFWIDDRDMPSKRMFSFIMFIFTLVEPGSKEPPPVLTIPTG
jgi:hypothetical protein